MVQKSKKREQLIETGKELFLRFGVKRVSIEEICKTSNVSKVTFYKYFENKSSLVKTIGDGLIDVGFSKFDEISELDLPYMEKINLMSKWRVEFFRSINSEFLDQIIEMDMMKEEFKRRYLKNIQIAQDKGEIKKELSAELIWLVTEKMREVTTEGAWREYFTDYAEYQDQMRILMFFGMLEQD